jgi:hypothetical protein
MDLFDIIITSLGIVAVLVSPFALNVLLKKAQASDGRRYESINGRPPADGY